MQASSNSIETLKQLRTQLLKLHRELIDSERAVFERSAGPIPSPGAFLQLLAHDPWFEWLRPMSQLIAKIDHALADKKQPITETISEQLIDETQSLITPDEHGDGFAKNYFELMQRDPHIIVAHSEVRELIK